MELLFSPSSSALAMNYLATSCTLGEASDCFRNTGLSGNVLLIQVSLGKPCSLSDKCKFQTQREQGWVNPDSSFHPVI